MQYYDGSLVTLGDIVFVPVPSGTARAHVVMLSETYEHLDIEAQFLSWVKKEKVLEFMSVVIEWLEVNPVEHNDTRFAPVGNYMFSSLDAGVRCAV